MDGFVIIDHMWLLTLADTLRSSLLLSEAERIERIRGITRSVEQRLAEIDAWEVQTMLVTSVPRVRQGRHRRDEDATHNATKATHG
jgi:hypothetical protein